MEDMPEAAVMSVDFCWYQRFLFTG